LRSRAIRDSYRYDIILYGAVYKTLSEVLDAPLITADKKLHGKTGENRETILRSST
jgi:predicted nucleic acid-binding protein